MVVVTNLGAVAIEFICGNWEWRGMNTDIYFFG